MFPDGAGSWGNEYVDNWYLFRYSQSPWVFVISMNVQEIIRSIEAEFIKSDLPELYIGDTIRVGVKIKEGEKERVQPYEGVIIARRNGGINETISSASDFIEMGWAAEILNNSYLPE